MKIRAIKHTKCGDTIYSRAGHDFKACSCPPDQYVYIDGGQNNDYYRIGGNPSEIIDVELDLDVTLKELYDDWNKSIDKYGLIKEKK